MISIRLPEQNRNALLSHIKEYLSTLHLSDSQMGELSNTILAMAEVSANVAVESTLMDVLSDLVGWDWHTDELIDVLTNCYEIESMTGKVFSNRKHLLHVFMSLTDEQLAASIIRPTLAFPEDTEPLGYYGDFEGMAETKEEAIRKEVEWLQRKYEKSDN